jgi:hypothetical protein
MAVLSPLHRKIAEIQPVCWNAVIGAHRLTWS